MKKALLFDLDDTLLDFQAAEKMALEKIFADFSIAYTVENLKFYQEINHGLWHDYEIGKIQREAITAGRFPLFFAACHLEADGLKAEEKFRSYLAQAKVEVPGAAELLGRLKTNYQLYLVTNGIAQTQRARLKNTGFDQYFSEVFISEELGAAKPDPQFFSAVLSRLPQLKKEEMLIIGDSLSADIKGGFSAHIDTVWFNPKNATPKYFPTYQIQTLPELTNLLAKIR
ncbi:YjjG family noncanonical pyrimidine nucleotidase [Enterococcus timonensis]|uniref:YjjG family noncanonical pyrimidine nucleotidase n=1 Tax=Enterococcus timonensis TaxID=1852364 RepID=UPI0008DB2D76|nr:YjjG family noncanonical pyrimidine nucleotidase [Enterococcus timonensis]